MLNCATQWRSGAPGRDTGSLIMSLHFDFFVTNLLSRQNPSHLDKSHKLDPSLLGRKK